MSTPLHQASHLVKRLMAAQYTRKVTDSDEPGSLVSQQTRQDWKATVTANFTITIDRAYSTNRTEGYQVLVDRLWPRGVTKAKAHVDEWLKAVAPSTDLRRWYGHQPALFDEFQQRYTTELTTTPEARDAVDHLLEIAATRNVVLVTATKDVEHSGAQVLLDHLNTLRQR